MVLALTWLVGGTMTAIVALRQSIDNRLMIKRVTFCIKAHDGWRGAIKKKSKVKRKYEELTTDVKLQGTFYVKIELFQAKTTK